MSIVIPWINFALHILVTGNPIITWLCSIIIVTFIFWFCLIQEKFQIYQVCFFTIIFDFQQALTFILGEYLPLVFSIFILGFILYFNFFFLRFLIRFFLISKNNKIISYSNNDFNSFMFY